MSSYSRYDSLDDYSHDLSSDIVGAFKSGHSFFVEEPKQEDSDNSGNTTRPKDVKKTKKKTRYSLQLNDGSYPIFHGNNTDQGGTLDVSSVEMTLNVSGNIYVRTLKEWLNYIFRSLSVLSSYLNFKLSNNLYKGEIEMMKKILVILEILLQCFDQILEFINDYPIECLSTLAYVKNEVQSIFDDVTKSDEYTKTNKTAYGNRYEIVQNYLSLIDNILHNLDTKVFRQLNDNIRFKTKSISLDYADYIPDFPRPPSIFYSCGDINEDQGNKDGENNRSKVTFIHMPNVTPYEFNLLNSHTPKGKLHKSASVYKVYTREFLRVNDNLDNISASSNAAIFIDRFSDFTSLEFGIEDSNLTRCFTAIHYFGKMIKSTYSTGGAPTEESATEGLKKSLGIYNAIIDSLFEHRYNSPCEAASRLGYLFDSLYSILNIALSHGVNKDVYKRILSWFQYFRSPSDTALQIGMCDDEVIIISASDFYSELRKGILVFQKPAQSLDSDINTYSIGLIAQFMLSTVDYILDFIAKVPLYSISTRDSVVSLYNNHPIIIAAREKQELVENVPLPCVVETTGDADLVYLSISYLCKVLAPRKSEFYNYLEQKNLINPDTYLYELTEMKYLFKFTEFKVIEDSSLVQLKDKLIQSVNAVSDSFIIDNKVEYSDISKIWREFCKKASIVIESFSYVSTLCLTSYNRYDDVSSYCKELLSSFVKANTEKRLDVIFSLQDIISYCTQKPIFLCENEHSKIYKSKEVSGDKSFENELINDRKICRKDPFIRDGYLTIGESLYTFNLDTSFGNYLQKSIELLKKLVLSHSESLTRHNSASKYRALHQLAFEIGDSIISVNKKIIKHLFNLSDDSYEEEYEELKATVNRHFERIVSIRIENDDDPPPYTPNELDRVRLLRGINMLYGVLTEINILLLSNGLLSDDIKNDLEAKLCIVLGHNIRDADRLRKFGQLLIKKDLPMTDTPATFLYTFNRLSHIASVLIDIMNEPILEQARNYSLTNTEDRILSPKKVDTKGRMDTCSLNKEITESLSKFDAFNDALKKSSILPEEKVYKKAMRFFDTINVIYTIVDHIEKNMAPNLLSTINEYVNSSIELVRYVVTILRQSTKLLYDSNTKQRCSTITLIGTILRDMIILNDQLVILYESNSSDELSSFVTNIIKKMKYRADTCKEPAASSYMNKNTVSFQSDSDSNIMGSSSVIGGVTDFENQLLQTTAESLLTLLQITNLRELIGDRFAFPKFTRMILAAQCVFSLHNARLLDEGIKYDKINSCLIMNVNHLIKAVESFRKNIPDGYKTKIKFYLCVLTNQIQSIIGTL